MYKCEKNETCNFGEVSFMKYRCIVKKICKYCESFDENNVLLINSIIRLFILL